MVCRPRLRDPPRAGDRPRRNGRGAHRLPPAVPPRRVRDSLSVTCVWHIYFSFDLEQRCYTVWLDDDPDDQNGSSHVFTFSPGFHQKSGKSVNEDLGHNGGDCSIGELCTEICTDQSSNLHHFPGTESLPAGAGDPTLGVCEIRSGENIPDIPEEIRPIREPAPSGGFSWCKSGCKEVKTGVNVQTTVPVNPATRTWRCSNSCPRNPVGFSNSAPSERRSTNRRSPSPPSVEKDEPCHVCGRRPTSSVKRGGGKSPKILRFDYSTKGSC